MPGLTFAGDADTTNPIAGGGAGATYWQYSQSAALHRWATLDGCSRPYARAVTACSYEQRYAQCADRTSVAARVMRGGRHSWSVVSNEVMWTCLSRHKR